MIDCGLAFPDSSMFGVDIVIPDFSYITEDPKKLDAIVLTHGHEDHIGALPYLLSEIIASNQVPVYGTALTLELIKAKLSEWEYGKPPKLIEFKAGEGFEVKDLKIKSYRVTHSIPDAVSYSFHSPDNRVVFWSGDFKLDNSPVDGKFTDTFNLSKLGQEGVLFASIDVTYVDRPGNSIPEISVTPGLEHVFRNYPGRIFTTCFASNIHRIQQIINVSAQNNRKVLLAGRTMERNVQIAKTLGIIAIPEDILIDIKELDLLPDNKVSVLVTGSQGEPQAALAKIAKKKHQIKINPGDRIIFSASPIPGNESEINSIVNALCTQKASVIMGEEFGVHAHGHAFQDDLFTMIGMVKPKFLWPQHGEIRHQNHFVQLINDQKLNIPMTIGANGNQYEISDNGVKMIGQVKAGAIYLNVDNDKVCVVSSQIITQRKRLADDGVIAVGIVLSQDGSMLMSSPVIRSNGILAEQDYADLFENVKKYAEEALKNNRQRSKDVQVQLRNNLEMSIQRYFDKEVGISPSVMVIINYLDPKRVISQDAFDCL